MKLYFYCDRYRNKKPKAEKLHDELQETTKMNQEEDEEQPKYVDLYQD